MPKDALKLEQPPVFVTDPEELSETVGCIEKAERLPPYQTTQNCLSER